MTEVEKQAQELKNTLDNLTANSATKEEVNAINDKIEKLSTIESVDAIKVAIDAIKEDLNQIKENRVNKSKANVEFGTFKSEELADIASLKETRTTEFKNFTTKAPATMLVSTHADAGLVRTSTDNEITLPLSFEPSVWDVIPKLRTNATIHKYTERYLEDGEALMTAEGAKKPLRDFKLRQREEKAKKVAVVEKASKEWLDDIDFIQDFMRSDMRKSVEDTMKYQALLGDGTGENLKGLMFWGQPFANTGSITVPNANVYDLFRLVASQIRVAGGIPTHLVLNPVDTVVLDLQKIDNGQYLIPPFTTNDGMVIRGMRVIEDANMPVGQYLAFDRNRCEVRIREDVNIQVGYENDDFTKNLVTFICESRAYLIVKDLHKFAFVKGTITDDLAKITVTEGNE